MAILHRGFRIRLDSCALCDAGGGFFFFFGGVDGRVGLDWLGARWEDGNVRG